MACGEKKLPDQERQDDGRELEKDVCRKKESA
jgi:hypothetical protein